MKKILFSSIFCFTVGCASSHKQIENNKIKINVVIDSWHKAAANAKFDIYFSHMTSNSVFIGTDATENWQNEAFRKFSKPFFDKGKAWNFSVLERTVYVDKSGKVAWFDELLSTQMKICRGSGVLVKDGSVWKISHYVLSMTIPNDKTDEVVKIKGEIETKLIKELEK